MHNLEPHFGFLYFYTAFLRIIDFAIREVRHPSNFSKIRNQSRLTIAEIHFSEDSTTKQQHCRQTRIITLVSPSRHSCKGLSRTIPLFKALSCNRGSANYSLLPCPAVAQPACRMGETLGYFLFSPEAQMTVKTEQKRKTKTLYIDEKTVFRLQR